MATAELDNEAMLADIADRHTRDVAKKMSGLGQFLTGFQGAMMAKQLTIQPDGFDADLMAVYNAATESPNATNRLLLQNQAVLLQIMRNTSKAEPPSSGEVPVVSTEPNPE